MTFSARLASDTSRLSVSSTRKGIAVPLAIRFCLASNFSVSVQPACARRRPPRNGRLPALHRPTSGQGTSLARLISVVVIVTVLVVIAFPFVVAKQRLAASRGCVSGGVGRGKAALQEPGCTEPKRSAGGGSWGGRCFGGGEGQSPSAPPTPRLRRWVPSGKKAGSRKAVRMVHQLSQSADRLPGGC